jgi:hypothetical protein
MLAFLEKVMVRVLLTLRAIKISVHQVGLESVFDTQSSDDQAARKIFVINKN